MHLLETKRVTHLVGGGSRLGFLESFDSELHHNPELAQAPFDDRVWLNPGIFTPGWKPYGGPPSGRVIFEGNVTNERRDQLYDEAVVVVAPAFKEDYGLTAIEAMIRAKPVIVCRDGGGLSEFIVDGETGVIIEPNAHALARAIDRLVRDPARASRLGEAARKAVQGVTLDQAVTQLEHALRTVLQLSP
jgi:glycosyltransferase involved in cell wall biosynthesis